MTPPSSDVGVNLNEITGDIDIVHQILKSSHTPSLSANVGLGVGVVKQRQGRREVWS